MKIIKKGVVSSLKGGMFTYQAWPSVCADENGDIYVVCSGLRMGHLCPFGKIVMYISRDGGETFSLPQIVTDSFLDDRDPGILYIGGGEMLVTRAAHPACEYETEYLDWIKEESEEAGTGAVKYWSRLSESDRKGGCFYRKLSGCGNTAGEEKRIPVHCPHGPVLLNNGEIFYLGKELYTKDEHFSVYISKNRGESFEFVSRCPLPDGFTPAMVHEVHCAQLPGGKIMALFRTHLTEDDNYFTITKTVSCDGGLTWSEWEKTGICGSPPHLCKTPCGSLALTYGRRIPPYGIYARSVSPEGEISGEEFMLDSCFDDDLGYPATVSLPDGSLFTVFYAKLPGDEKNSIHYVRWEL